MNYSTVRKKPQQNKLNKSENINAMGKKYFFCFRNKINLGKIMEGWYINST